MRFLTRRKEPVKEESPTIPDTGSGKYPDVRRMMTMIQGDAKGHALNVIVASDKNNPIKANIHNVFNISAADVMAHWEEFESEIEAAQFFLNGRIGQDEGGYRINSRAEDGKATDQYVEGFKAWSLLGPIGALAGHEERLKEGDRKR